MASGKKGKKTKGKTLALTEFLQETTGTIPIQPLRKSNVNWADEIEDFDGFDSRAPVNVVLPTAPKASRDYDDISDKVPKEPPFMAYLSNLSYDVEEDEIAAFFKNLKIVNMRIPKDDRDGNKLKGYGYVEFEDRDSLLNALVMPDTTLKNRRIRIEVAANSENDRRRGRMDMGRDRMDRGETSGDWRSGPRSEVADNDRRGFSRDNDDRFRSDRERDDRPFNRDNMRSDREDRSFNRDNMRDRDSGFTRDRDSGFNRDRDRDSGFSRDKDTSFRRDRDGLDDRPGGWREARDSDRGFTRERGRNEDKDERRGFGFRRFEDRDRNGGFSRGSDKESELVQSEQRERPKLVLAPRTKPIENVPAKSDTVPSASIFGNAKPVDTSQREREIEQKLAKGLVDSRETSRDSDRRPPSSDEGERKNINLQDKRALSSENIERKNTERSSRPLRRTDNSPKRTYEEKHESKSDNRSPDKSDNKHKQEKPRKEEKRERHEKEMPKLSEPEPPNFAANNKFAFLQSDDCSD